MKINKMKKIVLVLAIILVGLQTYCQSSYKITTEIKYDSILSLDGKYFAAKENGFWGVVKANDVVLPFKYEAIDALGDDMITFVKNGKIGFADIKGNVIVPEKYSIDLGYQTENANELNIFRNGSCLVIDKNKLIIIDKNGKSIVGDTVEIVSKYDNTIIFKHSGAYGLMNAQAEVVEQAKYQQIQTVIPGKIYAYIAQRDGKNQYGLIEGNGHLLSYAYYDDIQIYKTAKQTYIKAYLPTGKQALYSIDGKILFQPLYQSIEPTEYDNYYNVTEQTKKGIIGRDYVLYVQPQYDNVKVVPFNEDTFFVCSSGQISYILNNKNQVVSQIEGNVIDIIAKQDNNILYIADSMLNYGVRCSDNTWKIKPEYSEVLCTIKNIIVLKKDKQWGAIDINGTKVIDFDYDKVKEATTHNNVAFYDNKKQSILLTSEGKQIKFSPTKSILVTNAYVDYNFKKTNCRLYTDGREIKSQFERIGSEKDGILAVKLKDGWTFVDSKTFKPLTDKHFDYVSFFDQGIALAVKDNNLITIDKNFNTIQTIISGETSYLNSLATVLSFNKQMKKNYFIVTTNNKQGVITINKANN